MGYFNPHLVTQVSINQCRFLFLLGTDYNKNNNLFLFILIYID